MKKQKLLTLLSILALCVCTLFIGVWAAKTATVTSGGSINFTATGVNCMVSGEIQNSTASLKTLPTLTFSANDSSDTKSWGTNNAIAFDDNETPINIVITVENLVDRALYARVVDPVFGDGSQFQVSLSSKLLTLNTAGDGTITITITPKPMDVSLVEDYSFNVSLSSIPPALMEDEVIVDYATDSESVLKLTSDSRALNKSRGYGSVITDTAYCLRDDLVIYAQNQERQGICWAFSVNTVLETTLMKATGEFYDFSDGWVSLAAQQTQKYLENQNAFDGLSSANNLNYLIGGGGHMILFDAVVRSSGLVLEQDFKYEDFYWIDQTNSTYYYNFYKNMANKQIMENLTMVKFYLKSTNSRNAIKEHLKLYGAVDVSYRAVDLISAEDNSYAFHNPTIKGTINHSASIIGWDDTFTQVINGNTYTGAWIVQQSFGNAWGNEGVAYLFYDDPNYTGNYYAYMYDETNDDLSLHTSISSGYDYETSLKGKYYSPYQATSNSTIQKNVIFVDNAQNDYQIRYDYTLTEGAKIDSINVYYAGKDVTGSLVDVQLNDGYYIVKNSIDKINLGGYKIITKYSNGTNSESYINNFYIIDGMEVGSIISITNNSAQNTNGMYFCYNTYNYNGDLNLTFATNKKNTQEVNATIINGSTYGIIDASNTTLSVSVDGAKVSYMYNSNINAIYVYYNLSGDSSLITYTFTHSSGRQKNINVKIIYTTLPFVQVNYNANGGDNSINSNKKIQNENGEIEIYAPTREGYEFMGWYYDADFVCPVHKVNNKYYIGEKGISWVSAPNNYFHLKDGEDTTTTLESDLYYGSLNSCFIYAKWKKL